MWTSTGVSIVGQLFHVLVMFGSVLLCTSTNESHSATASPAVYFQPVEILELTEGSVQSIFVEHTSLSENMTMFVEASDRTIVEVIDTMVDLDKYATPDITLGNFTNSTNPSFRVRGLKLGKTSLRFNFRRMDGVKLSWNDTPATSDYPLWVIRSTRLVDVIFPYVIVVLLVVNTCTMGCKLEWQVIKSLLVRPLSVSIGAFCQFVGMPLFAFVLSVAFSLSLESALGLMLMGSCPGGGLSNIFSVLLDGDLSLSITMTFISSVLALGMMSLNLFIYSHYWVAGGHSFPVPYIQIMVSLALLCIPVAIGMITRSRKPEWAKKGVALIRPIGLLLILLALTTGVYSNLYLADQWTLTIVLASVLLPILGFILGATLARVFRRDFQKTVTISLETGIQNSALATGLIKMVYEQPDSDLLAVVPLTSAMGQFFLGIMAYVVYLLSKVTKRRNAEQKDKEQVTVITDEYTDSFQMSDGEDTSPKHISPPLSPDITYVI